MGLHEEGAVRDGDGREVRGADRLDRQQGERWGGFRVGTAGAGKGAVAHGDVVALADHDGGLTLGVGLDDGEALQRDAVAIGDVERAFRPGFDADKARPGPVEDDFGPAGQDGLPGELVGARGQADAPAFGGEFSVEVVDLVVKREGGIEADGAEAGPPGGACKEEVDGPLHGIGGDGGVVVVGPAHGLRIEPGQRWKAAAAHVGGGGFRCKGTEVQRPRKV